MSFDDTKEFNGRKYTGMAVGSDHHWNYPNGVWDERKISPDVWSFKFTSLKQRVKAAPVGSGVPLGTSYDWYIVADQKVEKLDADTYATVMEGTKFKIGHKRPYWKGFSYTYPCQASYRRKVIDALKETISELERQESEEITRALMRSAGGQSQISPEMAKV
jgi:hypothetical protein